MTLSQKNTGREGVTESDYRFLMETPFFENIPDEARLRLLVALKPVRMEPGRRFISQGEEGDSLYLIQSGRCTVTVEKDGVNVPLAAVGPGDVVGEMAVLTGENRNAHVETLGEALLWRLERNHFERICSEYPEIRSFLTEIVTNRFANAPLTAYRTIGKYVLNEVKGGGGSSIVYKGTHTGLDMTVAVKMLKHNLAMDPGFIETFQNEAKTIARLNHANIVRIFDIEQLYRTVFIIMEYLEGASLENVLENEAKLPLSRVLDIILQICAALKYAHQRGLVHRDIKPANIFVQNDGRIKMLDFGLACARGTRGCGFVGTPRYVAPEQISEQPVDERTDIYSLGLLAFRMMTGRDVFQDTDAVGMLLRHLYEEVPDPGLFAPDLPESAKSFIRRATLKDPSQRYQTIGEVEDVLQPLMY